jgi:hypothetical protein
MDLARRVVDGERLGGTVKPVSIRVAVLACMVLFVGGGVSDSHAATDVNLFVGQKQLDEQWEPLDRQNEFGIQSTVGAESWPVRIAVDLLTSTDEVEEKIAVPEPGTVKLEGTTLEFDIGVRRIWEINKIRPFIGAGPAWVHAKVNGPLLGEGVDIETDNGDSTLGVWVDAGVFFRLGDVINVGIGFRATRAEVNIGGVDIEGGGKHIGILLGAGW